jgi:hypothetical protein
VKRGGGSPSPAVTWIHDAITEGGHVDLPAPAPIMVLGDLNIVGASDPLDTLITGDIRGNAAFGPDGAPDWDGTYATDAKPVHNGRGDETYTWRDDGSDFPPGRLDFVIYTDSVLEVVHSFVLNTVTMTEEELEATGLERLDVTRGPPVDFDHLPVVVDMRSLGEE